MLYGEECEEEGTRVGRETDEEERRVANQVQIGRTRRDGVGQHVAQANHVLMVQLLQQLDLANGRYRKLMRRRSAESMQ